MTQASRTTHRPGFPNAPRAEIIEAFDVGRTAPGTVARYYLPIVTDGMGLPVYVPVMVARGVADGPVVGITAAVHGNELNGIPVIQRLFGELEVDELRGTVVGVPGVNVPSLVRKQRRFIDGVDLNHVMPGRVDGTVSQVYAHRVFDRLVRHFDYLFDLHTASNGRVNSYYLRADMASEEVRRMALLQGAQIIVHNPPGDGTLRGAADALGIPALTFEVGDPNTFQRGVIRESTTGIYNFLIDRGMVDGDIDVSDTTTVNCQRSYWIYTDEGGLLSVLPRITDRVEEGQSVAVLRNVFGDEIKTFVAPEAGIVIGHSVSPVCQTGGRILHLGVVG